MTINGPVGNANKIGILSIMFDRDVGDLLAERGLHADHITVWRWVQRIATCFLGTEHWPI